MNWNLPIDITHKSSFNKISYQHKILLLGSCFSENIGSKLNSFKFQVNSNPFGILYNPKSIYTSIQRIVENVAYTNDNLTIYNNQWLSLDHHTSFSDPDQEKTLRKINGEIEIANSFLQNTDTIIVTFGTAFYYKNKASKKAVGNCHKIPGKEFVRKQLSIGEIIEDYGELMEQVVSLNSKIQWIFTVSPVRHWKDGAIDNNWSKSTLICAIQEMVKANSNVHYFPAYEIMMDELRDHRFYKEDMIHPNEQAVNHIWNKFLTNSMDSKALDIYDKIREIKKACKHKPFNFKSTQHQSFIVKIESRLSNLMRTHNFLNFDTELAQLHQK